MIKNKRSFKLFLAFFAFSPLASCATRFMTVPLTSMTQSNIPSGASLEDLGTVSAKWCDNEPSVLNETNIKGYVDEVTKKAQDSKQADYLANATYMFKPGFFSSSCMEVSGSARKIAGGASAAPTKQVGSPQAPVTPNNVPAKTKKK